MADFFIGQVVKHDNSWDTATRNKEIYRITDISKDKRYCDILTLNGPRKGKTFFAEARYLFPCLYNYNSLWNILNA